VLRCCVCGGGVALADRGQQWSLTALDSDAGGECVECHAEPVVSGFVGGDFVVAAAQVLHEGVPCRQGWSGPEAFQAPHWTPPGFEPAVVGFNGIVGVLLDDV
jgi:hypothetical protein